MSDFDNWKEEQERIHNDYDAENAWYAGQQAQQAKIDELQKQVITQGQNFNDQAQKLKDTEYFNQKLQARVDEAIKKIDIFYMTNGLSDLTHDEIHGILKGNKDEN